jgi:hypothetical protein
MKRINHMQHGIASFSSSAFRLRRLLVVERASLARPTSSGWQHRPWATADRLSSNSASRSIGVSEYWSFGLLLLSGRARVPARRENVPGPKGVFSSPIKIRTRLRQQSRGRGTRTRSLPVVACVFYGLSLELSARTVINNETVLPKAARTAGIMLPRLNLGVASADCPRRAATISLERRVVSKQ